MSKVIIYPWDGHIAVSWPNPRSRNTLQHTAENGTPVGLPYRIIDASDLPTDWDFFDAWTADFSSPDGTGTQIQEGGA
jgi:hypothetical protein